MNHLDPQPADNSATGTAGPRPRILVLTGPFRAGKTTLCRQLAHAARARGWRVDGLLCPALFEAGEKRGIIATALRSGESRLLAVPHRLPDPQSLGYRFDEQALAWADRVIAASTPSDLLIVDELGPLEIEMGRGFLSAFDLLRHGDYRLAVVVVRPSLLELFAVRMGLPFETLRVEGQPHEADLGLGEREPDGDTLDPARPQRCLPALSTLELPGWFEEYLRG